MSRCSQTVSRRRLTPWKVCSAVFSSAGEAPTLATTARAAVALAMLCAPRRGTKKSPQGAPSLSKVKEAPRFVGLMSTARQDGGGGGRLGQEIFEGVSHRVQVGVDISMVELHGSEHRERRLEVDKLGALVEKRGVVFVPFQ